MLLKPGDIVTDLDEESRLRGQQGIVAQVQLLFWNEDPEVSVLFDWEVYPYHFSSEKHVQAVREVYPPHLLRRDDDWKPEVYARRLFKDKWHLVRTLKAPLDAEQLCLVEGCPYKQEETAWFNIWGSVCNAHVCAEHARQYHGMRADSFPWRKRTSA